MVQSYSATPIPYKGANIVAIWQHDKRVFGIFSLRMLGIGYLGASGQKSYPAIRSGDVDFLYNRELTLLSFYIVYIFPVIWRFL